MEEKYRLIENYITLVEKLENSLNEHGIKTELRPKQIPPIFTGKLEDGNGGEIVIEINSTEHDRKVLEGSKHE